MAPICTRSRGPSTSLDATTEDRISALVKKAVGQPNPFLGGADFDEPPPLGDSDRSRYIKVKSLDEINEEEFRTWIENACRVDGWT